MESELLVLVKAKQRQGQEFPLIQTACSLGLSATSQQYFSLRTNQPPATSQQYSSLRTNQHQPSATSQPNRLKIQLLGFVFKKNRKCKIAVGKGKLS
jgi:hypothetical protein